jgi:hypothetical protein
MQPAVALLPVPASGRVVSHYHKGSPLRGLTTPLVATLLVILDPDLL